jgi:hypothetical protein
MGEGIHGIFWSEMTTLVSGNTEWVMGNDVNATLHRWELTQPYSPKGKQVADFLRRTYWNFMTAVAAVDSWESQLRVHGHKDWTAFNYADLLHKTILDRSVFHLRMTCRLMEAVDVIPGYIARH